MKEEYDLSKMKSRKNPYASKLKKPVISDLGRGDYTKERQQWLGNPSLGEIADGIKAMRKSRTNPSS